MVGLGSAPDSCSCPYPFLACIICGYLVDSSRVPVYGSRAQASNLGAKRSKVFSRKTDFEDTDEIKKSFVCAVTGSV